MTSCSAGVVLGLHTFCSLLKPIDCGSLVSVAPLWHGVCECEVFGHRSALPPRLKGLCRVSITLLNVLAILEWSEVSEDSSASSWRGAEELETLPEESKERVN